MGLRVVITQKYQARMLNELHNQHPGIVIMKVLSRIYVWLPGIDLHIEQTVKRCSDCQRLSRDPIKAFVHPWDWPTQLFDRVHVDFLGPFFGKSCLLLVDSHSKWIEVEITRSTTTYATVTTSATTAPSSLHTPLPNLQSQMA